MNNNSNDKVIFLWQDELIIPLLIGLKVAEGTAEYVSFSAASKCLVACDSDASIMPVFSPVYPSKEIMCSCCQLNLDTRNQLINHYEEDWHKVNIKRTIVGLQPISFQQYESSSEPENNGNESDSASEEEVNLSEDEQELFRQTPKVYFKNVDGTIVSIYKMLLLPPKKCAETEIELVRKAHFCNQKLHWVIILVSGGSFAATVFKGPNVIVHKTFHSYTIRAKQGGSQSSYDNRKGRQANSAGASLRRYNERAFSEHVQNILCEWKDNLEKCDLIFHRSPLNNRHILFGGQSPILKKHDYRLRNIPFVTKRPTFNETIRIHHELSKVILYDSKEFELKSQQNKIVPQRPIPKVVKNKEKVDKIITTKKMADIEENSSESSCCEDELICRLEEINFSGLEEYGYVQTVYSDEDSEEAAGDTRKEIIPLEVRNTVFNACVKGNLFQLEAMTKCSAPQNIDEDQLIPPYVMEYLLNNKGKIDILKFLFGPSKKTILHVAAENCRNDMIWWLMEQGCDPTIVDLNNRLPYCAAPNKEVRNHFRRFMAAYPDKFNYNQARIPAGLTKDQENDRRKKQIDKKKTYKNMKRLKEVKAQKKEEIKLKMAKEVNRFNTLPDREKRAIAAERRLLDEKGNGSIVRQLCYFCNMDMTGNVPFSYDNKYFCTTTCVKRQRKKINNK